jgi:hypothetical protein
MLLNKWYLKLKAPHIVHLNSRSKTLTWEHRHNGNRQDNSSVINRMWYSVSGWVVCQTFGQQHIVKGQDIFQIRYTQQESLEIWVSCLSGEAFRRAWIPLWNIQLFSRCNVDSSFSEKSSEFLAIEGQSLGWSWAWTLFFVGLEIFQKVYASHLPQCERTLSCI